MVCSNEQRKNLNVRLKYYLCIEGYDMAKNSFPAEEILKHICKYKKSRALGHEDKDATLSERGRNA